jgi:hypothetical protein
VIRHDNDVGRGRVERRGEGKEGGEAKAEENRKRRKKYKIGKGYANDSCRNCKRWRG